jgi:hypothetical protein
MLDVILKRLDVRGRFELVTIGGLTIGRATYEPGWPYVSPHFLGAGQYAR